MKRILTLFLVFVFLCFASPGFADNNKTQLQTREYQTKTYSDKDAVVVTKAVINALQDYGYEIKIVNKDLDYITAKQEYQRKQTSKMRVFLYSLGFLHGIASAILTYGIESYIPIRYMMLIRQEFNPKYFLLYSTVNITQYGNDTKVRVNFSQKVYGKRDGKITGKKTRISTAHVATEKVYQDFFSKVDKNLYIEKNANN